MTQLQTYDKDNIEPKIIRRLKAQYLDLPEMDVKLCKRFPRLLLLSACGHEQWLFTTKSQKR